MSRLWRLTAYFNTNDYLAPILGLAWGLRRCNYWELVTVPLVLALGIGIASAAGKGDSSLSGFGIVTLASVFPVMAVMLLGLYVYFSVTPQEIVASATMSATAVSVQKPWYSVSPYEEMVLGVRAIVPLVIFLFIIMKLVLKERLKNSGTIMYGIVLAVIGMMIF